MKAWIAGLDDEQSTQAMNTPILFTLGTPGGCWPEWATSMLQTAPAGSRLLSPAFTAWHDALDLPTPGLAPLVSDALRARLDSLIPADADSAPWGGLDPRACWSLEALAQRFPNASFLVFVERPAIGLARALTTRPDLDPCLWLASWREAARRILRHHQRQPSRSILIDTQEAQGSPASLCAVLRTRIGTAAAPTGLCEPPTNGDALALALSEALIAGYADIQSVLEELVTACQPLAELDLVHSGTEAPRIAPARALHRFHELLQARAELDSVLQSLRELKLVLQATAAERDTHAAASADRLEQLETLAKAKAAVESTAADQAVRLEQLTVALERAALETNQCRSELEEARSRAASTLKESELLLLQLHQVQEELETLSLDSRATEAELQGQIQSLAHGKGVLESAAAEGIAQLETLTAGKAAAEKLAAGRATQIQQMTQERDEQAKAVGEQTARAAALSSALEDANEHLSQRQSELDAARSQVAASSQESELLLLQLHQVQEELEHYYLECRKIQDAAKGAGLDSGRLSASGFKGSISEALPTFQRDTPPHREITFELTGVRSGSRGVAECRVRLVEHHGHPGLALFANPEGPQLLERWTESGREGDRPYLLLVPTDLQSRKVLENLSTEDWLILQALVLKMEGSLEEAGSQFATHWRAVARRFREQLLELPRRFRFQAFASEFHELQGPVILEFRGVHCGARQIERLTIHWRPDGPQAGLSLLRDPDWDVPLTSWPYGDDGSIPDRLNLLIGPEIAEEIRRQQWLSLSSPDRDFLLAMLEILPEAVAHRGGVHPDSLVPAATALLEKARRSLAPAEGAPRGLLRRVVRRLRGRPARVAG